MSSNDYVRHITLKYSLATAIAVLKSKPEHLTTEEYLTTLRNKLKPDEMASDFEITSLASDDFDIPDQEASEPDRVKSQTELLRSVDSVTILRDFRPDESLLGNNEGNWQFASYSIDEALELLDDMGMEVSNAGLSQSVQTHTQETPTELTCLDGSQATKKIHGIKENIAKFIINVEMETVAYDKKIVDNTLNGKTIEKTLKTNAAMNLPKEETSRPLEKQKPGVKNADIDTQETQLYSISEYTQNSHISQSQTEDKRFDTHKYLTSKPNNKRKSTENPVEIDKMCKTTEDKEFDNTQDYLDTDFEIGPIKEIKLSKVGHNTVTAIDAHNLTQTEKISDNTTNTANNTKTEIRADIHENINPTQTSQNVEFPSQNDSEDEIFDSQSETTIPFKVIEELNRVKSTFNRRERKSSERVSSDSGYMSLHRSGNWVNQSAHTLYDYLLSCPLTPNTAEIVKEISQVLGDLIDKLHTEESYPSFLDEMLGSVEALLDQLSAGSCEAQAMAAKDESIQRILLLNTSVHIITSTVEKITTKLERLHEKITREAEIYELTHIRDVENTVYVFHTLEVLLQRYVKKKSILSSQASSQKSEDEKMPRRSSIADIWKQKWDPEFKKKDKIMNLDSNVKCVDMKIGEVLNKLVIGCMEGYSLVSFAALQCFNVLQS